jgi:hypothetical protein
VLTSVFIVTLDGERDNHKADDTPTDNVVRYK